MTIKFNYGPRSLVIKQIIEQRNLFTLPFIRLFPAAYVEHQDKAQHIWCTRYILFIALYYPEWPDISTFHILILSSYYFRMANKMELISVVSLTCVLLQTASAAKILMLPMYHNSHVNMFLVAGKALQKAGKSHACKGIS